MEKILFLAYTEADGTLPRTALEALSAARELAADLGAPLHIGLVGADVNAAAALVGGAGADSVLGVHGADFELPRYGSDAAACQALCEKTGATIVVTGATSRASRVLPGVAQRLGGKVDTQLSGLSVADGAVSVSRWFYRQRMEGTLSRTTRPWFLTVAPGSFPAYSGEAVQGTLESVDAAVATRTETVGVEAPSGDEQTIRPDADLLFVAGAGWTKKQGDGQTHVPEAGKLILGVVDAAKASLGSSKSLVDMGGEGQDVLPFLTHMHQVGQTGSTPRHAKGLATCCHGEEPHVVGWRFIKERRAVNLDAGCGWAQGKADVLYVADAFEVMAKVNELLGE